MTVFDYLKKIDINQDSPAEDIMRAYYRWVRSRRPELDRLQATWLAWQFYSQWAGWRAGS